MRLADDLLRLRRTPLAGSGSGLGRSARGPASRCPPRSSARGSCRRRRSPPRAHPARGASARGTRRPSRGRTSRRRRPARRRPTEAPARHPRGRRRAARCPPPPSRASPSPSRARAPRRARGRARRGSAHGRTRPASRRGAASTARTIPSDCRSPPICSIAASQRSIASSTSVGPSDDRRGIRRCRAALLTDVTRAARVLDRVERRLGGVAEAAGSSGCPGEETPGHREPCLVARRLEDRDGRRDLLLDRVGAPSFGPRAESDEKPDERRTCCVRGRDRRLADGLLEHGRRLVEPPRHEQRLTVLGQETEALGVVGREKRGSPSRGGSLRPGRRRARRRACPPRRAGARRPPRSRGRGRRAGRARTGTSTPARGGSRGSPRTPRRGHGSPRRPRRRSARGRSARARLRMPS